MEQNYKNTDEKSETSKNNKDHKDNIGESKSDKIVENKENQNNVGNEENKESKESKESKAFKYITRPYDHHAAMEIYDLREATKQLMNDDGEWLDFKGDKDVPQMVRYFKLLHNEDWPIIQKWLKLDQLKYFGAASTNKSANLDVIFDWIEEINISFPLDSEEPEKRFDKKTEEVAESFIYKLIYLNVDSTIHALNFDGGNFDWPKEWLENHRQYHLMNCCYE